MTRLPLDGRAWPDLAPAERTAVLDWIVDLCLLADSEHSTAYLVAAEFAMGVEDRGTTLRLQRAH